MFTPGIAALISCAILPIFYLVGMSLIKRTVYTAIASDDGMQRDEQAERDRVKAQKETSVKRVAYIYLGIVVTLFISAYLVEPVGKVRAALWPTATPTVTITPSPTITRTPSSTPTPSGTPADGASNFLTTIAGNVSGTPGTPMRTPTLPPSGGGGGVVVVTRIVIQTRIVTSIAYQTVVYIVPMTVIVTPTFTPLPTATTGMPSETLPPSATNTPTPTPTWTFTPTPTYTETPTP